MGSVAACATIEHCEADGMEMGRNTNHFDTADWLVGLGQAGLRLMDDGCCFETCEGQAHRLRHLDAGQRELANPRRVHPSTQEAPTLRMLDTCCY